ncbi:hypothetical protein [Spirochaeta dissipatitropha]
MRSLQRSMKEAQKTYQSSNQSLEAAWLDLGTVLLDSGEFHTDQAQTDWGKDAETARSAKNRKSHNQSIIDDITGLLQEKQEILSSLKDVPARIKSAEAANKPVFRHVGELVISLYGHRELASRSFSELLKPAREISRQISDIDREIDQLQAGKGRLGLNSIGGGLKIATRKSRRSSLQKYLEQEASELGKKLLGENLLQELMDPDVETAAAGYWQNQKRIDEIRTAQSELESTMNTINDRLGELCGSKNPNQQLDILELENRALQKEIETLLVSIAKKYYSNNPLKEGSTPNGVQELIRRIQVLTEEAQSEQQRIERIEAAIQLRKAQSRQQDIKKKLHTTEQQIQSLQQEKQRYEDELFNTEAEIQRLIESRGSIQGISD